MSILRYPGGKTRAIKVLNNELPNLNEFDHLVSPFFGGGSFEIYVANLHQKKVIANDKFTPLYNFWKHAQSSNNELVDNIKSLLPINKEKFYQYRRDLFEIDDSLLKASYYYIINRCSFSGTTCSGGFSQQAADQRLTKSALERLHSFDGTNFEFYNLDFSDFIDDHSQNDNNTDLIYADPPYYLEKNSKLYGKQGDLHENFDHKQLFDKLVNCESKFLLCYNDCDFIRELYKDYNIKKVDWSYGMNKSKTSSEIVITSYDTT